MPNLTQLLLPWHRPSSSRSTTSCSVCLSALLLAICLLPVCDASVTCFSNGATNFLRDDVGTGGLITCTGTTECYETLAKGKSGSTAVYSASCGGCAKWSVEADCKTCSSDQCNNVFQREILEKNQLCFQADDEPKIGEKRIWCADGIQDCYISEYVNKYGEKRYNAGCGDGGWPEFTVCQEFLCNIPPELRPANAPKRGQVRKGGGAGASRKRTGGKGGGEGGGEEGGGGGGNLDGGSGNEEEDGDGNSGRRHRPGVSGNSTVMSDTDNGSRRLRGPASGVILAFVAAAAIACAMSV